MSFKIIITNQNFLNEEEKQNLELKYEHIEYKRIPIITEFSKVYKLDENLAIKSHSFAHTINTIFKFKIKDYLLEEAVLEAELNLIESLYKKNFMVPKPLGLISMKRKGLKKVFDNYFEKNFLLLEHKGGIPSLDVYDKEHKLIIRNLIKQEKQKLLNQSVLNYSPSIENSLYNLKTRQITFFGITKKYKKHVGCSQPTYSQTEFKLAIQ